MPDNNDSVLHQPATLRERLEWLLRLAIPLAAGGWIEWRILNSLSTADSVPWRSFQWSQMLHGDFSSFDVDRLAANLASWNIVTKAGASVSVLIVSLYFADYVTTGRRRGWQLLASPFGKSARLRFRFWVILYGFYLLAVAVAVTLIQLQQASVPAVFRLLMMAHVMVALTLIVANDSFEGFLKQLPGIRQRRQQKQRQRETARRERQQRRREAEAAAQQREQELQARDAEVERLRLACGEIDEQIAVLQGSRAPDDVIRQQVAELQVEYGELQQQIQQLGAGR